MPTIENNAPSPSPKPPAWAPRLFDLILILLGAPLWIPTLCLVALSVRLALGAPVFFVQERPGQHGRLFRLIKFRTMIDATHPETGEPLSDAERLTPFGHWLRSTSLDELPELLNVLRGDMRLVGPRPLLREYLERYSPEQGRRHEVPPGITGWAQVHGRNQLDWEERFELDVWYVDHRSLILDLKILALTAWKVIHREGISAPGEATMPPFQGKDHSSSDTP